MLKRGFSFSFLLKKKPPKEVGSKVSFYTTKPDIVRSKRKTVKLVWKPRTQPRSFRMVSKPLVKVGLGVSLALLVYWLLGSNAFVLREFVIEGNHLIPAEEIEQSMFKDGFKEVNTFLFNERKAEAQILSIPQIKSAKFSKLIFKKRLLVKVAEHETTIIWQTNNERFMVNRGGVIYDVAADDSPLIVVEDLKNVPVNLNQRIVTTEFIEFVTSIVANIPRKTNLAARRVIVPETTFEIEVVTSEGWKIIFDTTRSFETQLNNLVKVLRSTQSPPKQYVDLRIEDRVYYK